jgi:hypothetical protein
MEILIKIYPKRAQATRVTFLEQGISPKQILQRLRRISSNCKMYSKLHRGDMSSTEEVNLSLKLVNKIRYFNLEYRILHLMK